MKTVQIGQTRYYIQDKEDLVTVVHELARQGYTNQQIANLLGISERTVKKYMSECW